MKRLAAWVWLALFCTAAQAQTDPATEQHIQHIVNGILPPVLVRGQPIPKKTFSDEMAKLHVPGISIAYIHDGKVAWARGFGVAKIGGPAVTIDTLFQAGSISKPVTAMAVLHLVQSGKLALDTNVNQYLTSWQVPDNKFTEQREVTLRELLTHTAGMTVHGFAGYAKGTAVPTLVQVLTGISPANSPAIHVDTTPGTIWRYSGGGYVVMQQMLDDVTGEPFPKLMHDTVLAPIGMTHSTYEQPLPTVRLAEAATPYDKDGNAVEGGPHTYPEMAPAGLWTTPSDLARYAMEIQKSLSGKSNRVLSMAMTTEMLKPGGLGSWGLGLQLDGGPGHTNFGHGGANEGFISNLIAYNDGDGVAIMTNGDNGGQLAAEVVRSIAHEYGWPDFAPKERSKVAVAPDTLEKYVGYYKLSPEDVVAITRDRDKLFARTSRQPRQELFPSSNVDYFFTNMDAQITFSVDKNGQVTGLISHVNGKDHVAPRIADTDPLALWANTISRRMDRQIEAPGLGLTLKNFINELRIGKPNYNRMTPALAEAVRDNLSADQRALEKFGATQSVEFQRVTPDGWDVYDVKFAHGGTTWTLLLNPKGLMENSYFEGQ